MTKIDITLFAFLLVTINLVSGQTKYQNEKYGFSGKTPDDWHIYAEIKDDSANKIAIIDWGLPKVFSESENTYIENAISIIAYKRSDIKNIDDLIKLEFERISDILESKEIIDSNPYTSFITITEINGLKYKSKVSFVFQNSIGYVLNFVATLGTFDINVFKFDSFIQDIRFHKPSSKQQSTKTTNIRFDGLYIVKTGVINIPNNKMDIYTYLRFYDDGTVYTQTVTSYAPNKVIKWFGKNGRFERKGKYKIEGTIITFNVSNDKSPDKSLEGAKSDTYYGKITDENKLYLQIDYNNGEHKEYWFEFTIVE